ncbi:endonuclease/exonuclease/phosphatase family protein [Streptomyces sp. 8N114]|uniref:endonuclease/exonuclease/phosphatase family protein n=1 Tax=Streptomyces sp. 8N114 TaxID=3457419 RepID=UPI003FD5E529
MTVNRTRLGAVLAALGAGVLAATTACTTPTTAHQSLRSGPDAASKSSPAAARSVRVMTWNWEMPKNPWYKPGWTNVIKNQRPDVLGLQEICVKWVDHLLDDLKAQGLHYEAVHGTWRTDWRCGNGAGSKGANGDALLVRKGAGKVLSKGTFRLPAVSTSEDKEERGVVWARVGFGKRTVPVWNTHIGYKGTQTEQTQALANGVGTPQAGILMGDLNSEPTAQGPLKPLWKAGWKEADPRCVPDATACPPTHDVGKKFDYIFHRGLTATSARSIPTPTSDHHVVLATFTI